MGANQGRAKGNEQEAEYEKPEGRHEKSGRKERGKPRKRERKGAPRKPLRGGDGKREERKKQKAK